MIRVLSARAAVAAVERLTNARWECADRRHDYCAALSSTAEHPTAASSPNDYRDCVLQAVQSPGSGARSDGAAMTRNQARAEPPMAEWLIFHGTPEEAQRVRDGLIGIKATCRLKYPCNSDAVPSSDYDTCLRR